MNKLARTFLLAAAVPHFLAHADCLKPKASAAQTPAESTFAKFRKCPGATAAKSSPVLESFLEKTSSGDWKGYGWDLSRAQFKDFEQGNAWAVKALAQGGVSFGETVEKADKAGSLGSRLIFTQFLLRVFPCADGEDAQTVGSLLDRAIDRDPEQFLNALLNEEKLEASWPAADRDACMASVRSQVEPPLLTHWTLIQLMASWPDGRPPVGVSQKLAKVKAKFPQPDLKPLFEAYSKD